MNTSFLKKNNPIKIMRNGFLLWLLFYLLTPLKVKHQFSFIPILYILICYFSMYLGYNLTKTKQVTSSLVLSEKQKNILFKILYVTIAIALLGLTLKVFDKFVLRQTSFSNSMSENRKLLSQSGPSIISIISAITNPFSFIPLFICFQLKVKNKFLLFFCVLIFFSAAIEFLVLGSRSGLFILLILFGMILSYFKVIKLSLGKSVLALILLFSLAIYSANLFIDRTTEFTKSDQKSVRHILTRANYNYTIEPTQELRDNIINDHNKVTKALKLGGINFMQYYLHGVYEFNYMYRNYEGGHHYGAFTFNIFAKFINIALGANIDLEKIQESPPRTGVYTTFFGPIYMDFGWLAPMFMFMFGWVQKFVYNKTITGKSQYLPLLFYLLVVNFFMPVINFIISAQGLYIIIAFVLFASAFTALTSKLYFTTKDNKKLYVRVFK